MTYYMNILENVGVVNKKSKTLLLQIVVKIRHART